MLAGADATAAMALWREIAAAMGFGARVDQGTVPAGLHPTRSATLSVGRDVVGAVGEVHPDVCDAYDVDERVAVLELNLDVLLADEPKAPAWKPTSRYPSSDLDLAFAAPTTADRRAAWRRRSSRRPATCSSTSPCSTSTAAPGVADGERSLAFRLRLQAGDHTLTDDELTAVRAKVVAAVAKLGATLRG